MTPIERYGALVEFWDRCLQAAGTEEDEARFRNEAAKAWATLSFYERNAGAGFDLINGRFAWRSPLPKPGARDMRIHMGIEPVEPVGEGEGA